LDSGPKKRSFNLLERSSSELSVVYLSFSRNEPRPAEPGIESIAKRVVTVHREREKKSGLAFYLRVLANLGSPQPYFMRRNIDSRIQKLLGTLSREEAFDLLVCDGLDMAANIDFSLPAPKVLLAHEIETTLWRQRFESAHGMVLRAYYNYETKRMAGFETQMCNKFDLVLTASERSKELLESELKVRVPVEVIETGVDCSYFRPDNNSAVTPRRLVFTGSLDLLSNIDGLLWFAAEVYPGIKKEYPDVTLDIIGPDPSSEIRALAQKDRSIRVTGWVDDVRPYIASAEAFIVPLRTPGGTRVKIYEAMGMKKPVVSTGYGAEGLPVAHRTHLLIADSAVEFTNAVTELFDKAAEREAIAENGWRMVNENYDWSKMAARLVAIFRQLPASYKKS
jgi:glycosyltransferase involved in cell wall biosynthesis